ncbi:MAG: hypothetical protein IKQ99_03320 [Alphaproteobacteria bacterium]|nr:hypothetical protein [Alphaproteobacteria bacterium]
MGEIKKALKQLKKDAYQEYKGEDKPTKKESVSYFGRCVLYSSKLIFKEKEIITFAILQLVCIGLGYYLWVQMLDWIPEEVWESTRHSDNGSPADYVLLLWSFICVGLTTYPLGLLTACMGAAHFLHENGEESTIAKCFRIVLPRAWPIWIFSWIDGWWTVKRILERLPKKRDRVPLAQKLINEAIYQAWKIASLGFLPALIIGRGVADSCKDSLGVLKTHFKSICQLRIAYSVICWVFGIGSYIGCIFMAPYIFSHMSNDNDIYTFYVFAGVPMLVALFFIQVFFRPIYILSACRIYSNYVRENNIPIALPTVSKFSSTIVAFLVLAAIIGTVCLYRDALGITQLLSIPYK